MAKYSFLSLCLVLLLGTAMATTTTANAAAEAPHPQLLLQYGKPELQPDVLTPKITDCWKSILQTENCAHDILKSLAYFDVHVSKVCCDVLQKIGDKCIGDVFSKFPFNPFYPPIVKHLCGFAIAPKHGA